MKKRYYVAFAAAALGGAILLQHIQQETPKVAERVMGVNTLDDDKAALAPQEKQRPIKEQILDYWRPKEFRDDKIDAGKLTQPLNAPAVLKTVGIARTKASSLSVMPKSLRSQFALGGAQSPSAIAQAAYLVMSIDYGQAPSPVSP